MKKTLTGVLLITLCASTAIAETVLTLADALEAARTRRPELAAADARIRAARAAGEQAGAWPNPIGFVRLEGAPRDGSAWNEGERVAGLAQTLPLGGRIGANRRTAEAAAATLSHESEALSRMIAAEVRAAFAEAVHARDALALRRETVDIARRQFELAAEGVEQGDAPVSDRRIARAGLGVAEAELAAAVAAEEVARVALAAAIGDAARPVDGVVGETFAEPMPGTLERLVADLDDSPATLAVEGRVLEARAQVTAASRARIPDLDLEAGLRDAPAGPHFDIGLSVSLPLFDRGAAALNAARARAEARAADARAARRDIEARLRRAHAETNAAEASAAIYDETVVPEALAALKSAEAAYGFGETGLSEVLLARRNWLAARLAHIAYRLDADLARARLIALL